MAANLMLGKRKYVVLEEDEYLRLLGLHELPALPKPNEDGNYPAVPAARAIIARGIIIDRAAAGLSQKALADLAGIRFETLNRIEKGKVTPDTATIVKIDRALQRAKGAAPAGRKRSARAAGGRVKRRT